MSKNSGDAIPYYNYVNTGEAAKVIGYLNPRNVISVEIYDHENRNSRFFVDIHMADNKRYRASCELKTYVQADECALSLLEKIAR